MDTAQDIRSTASPTFAGLTLTGLTGILKAASGTISAVTGLTQTITIPDTDGINYHHLEFTDGILTGYEKDTNL